MSHSNELPQLAVADRPKTGSRYSARLRDAGQLPGVIYGHKQHPSHVAIDRKAILNLLHAKAHVLEVSLAGKKQPCLIKDVQWDHLGSHVVHVDLERVDLNERVTVEIELVITGEAAGLKEAGTILEHPLSSIEIECLVTQIPSNIKVDVSELKVGDTLLAKDLKLPAGVTTTLDPETLVASVQKVKEVVVEVAPAAEGTAAQPEVIGRKAEEGEEGAAGEGGDKKAADKK